LLVLVRVEHGYGKPSGSRGGGGGGGGGRGGKKQKFNKHRNGLKFVKKVPKFLQKMLQPSAEQQRDAAIKDAMKKKFRELQDDEMPVQRVLARNGDIIKLNSHLFAGYHKHGGIRA